MLDMLDLSWCHFRICSLEAQEERNQGEYGRCAFLGQEQEVSNHDICKVAFLNLLLMCRGEDADAEEPEEDDANKIQDNNEGTSTNKGRQQVSQDDDFDTDL